MKKKNASITLKFIAPHLESWSPKCNLMCIYWLCDQKIFAIGSKWDPVYEAFSQGLACSRSFRKSHVSSRPFTAAALQMLLVPQRILGSLVASKQPWLKQRSP